MVGRDPTAVAWATVMLYFIASYRCFSISVSKQVEYAGFAQIWRIAGVALVLLGVNKQIDFQTELIRLGRYLASSTGMEQWRIMIHRMFFFALFSASILTAFIYRRRICQFGRTFPFFLVGLSLIIFYVAIRAVSINHLGELLQIDDENHYAAFEVSGLLILCLSRFRMAVARGAKKDGAR
jgi:hypothetical protein